MKPYVMPDSSLNGNWFEHYINIQCTYSTYIKKSNPLSQYHNLESQKFLFLKLKVQYGWAELKKVMNAIKRINALWTYIHNILVHKEYTVNNLYC